MSRKLTGRGLWKSIQRLLRLPELMRVITAGRRNRLIRLGVCCPKAPHPPGNSVAGKDARQDEDKLWQQAG